MRFLRLCFGNLGLGLGLGTLVLTTRLDINDGYLLHTDASETVIQRQRNHKQKLRFVDDCQ